MMTLADVKAIISEYSDCPKSELVKDVLVGISALGMELEREQAIQEFMKEGGRHGLTVSKVRKCVAEFRAEATAETAGDVFFDDKAFRPIRVVESLMQSHDFITLTTDDKIRIYEGGVFGIDGLRRTEQEIISLLGDAAKTSYLSDVVGLLKSRTMALPPVHTDWVNLANGRLCLRSWELLEHSPVYQSVVQLPVEYNPDATCPVFNAWLADVLPAEDDQFLLLQLLGYSMLQDVRFGKIAVLYGPTHTGKSTCLNLIKLFLGKENVSALSLHALDNEDRRFSRAGLVGKLANISADLSSRYLRGDSQVKQIASGDGIDVEHKGVDGFSYEPFATLWASANQLPVSHDRSDAWYERLVILPFVNQHKGSAADRTIEERMTQPSELSGILNRAVGALQQLLSENAFIETDSTREMLAQYRLENDHVSRFLLETYEQGSDGKVSEDSLYDTYKLWCEDEGIKPLSKSKCRDGVTTFLGTQRKRLGPKGGERSYYWLGLA